MEHIGTDTLHFSLRSATSPKGRGKGVLMVLFGSRQSPDFFAGRPTYEMGM